MVLLVGALTVASIGSAGYDKGEAGSGARRGAQADDNSFASAISANGRYVAFASNADNLVAHDTNGAEDVFVRDLKREDQARQRQFVRSPGRNDFSRSPSISADGRLKTFNSYASNLVNGDTSGDDIFVRDMKTGKTKKVSAASLAPRANDNSLDPSISENGRFVAFDSDATNLVAGDTNANQDVFVRDLKKGKTRRASVN